MLGFVTVHFGYQVRDGWEIYGSDFFAFEPTECDDIEATSEISIDLGGQVRDCGFRLVRGIQIAGDALDHAFAPGGGQYFAGGIAGIPETADHKSVGADADHGTEG